LVVGVDLRSGSAGRVLVHCGCRLGHRPFLRRIRSARPRRYGSDVRRSADSPGKDRFWSICEQHGVTVFYTAPTAIRAFMKWGTELPARHDLSKLRLLGSVGEPINPEAWMWYQEHIGGGRCPIVDTWWQTETAASMITPLPGVITTKPGSATVPFPGIEAVLLDGKAKK